MFNTLPDLRVKILAEVTVGDNPDLAVADSHRIRGGTFALNTLAERDDLPPDLRKANVSRCWVEAEGKEYWLKGGITNAHWVVSMVANASGLVSVPGSATGGSSTNQNTTIYLESSVPSIKNKGMKSLSVSTNGQKLCATAIAEKPVGYVTVIVGGTAHTVGEDTSQEAYFSGDGGLTARLFGQIVVGDFCYWNPSAGFGIEANTAVEFHYEVLAQAATNTTTNPNPNTPEFIFEQATPASRWLISHPFGIARPHVFYTNLQGEQIEVESRYPPQVANGTIEAFADVPVAGRAYIRV